MIKECDKSVISVIKDKTKKVSRKYKKTSIVWLDAYAKAVCETKVIELNWIEFILIQRLVYKWSLYRPESGIACESLSDLFPTESPRLKTIQKLSNEADK